MTKKRKFYAIYTVFLCVLSALILTDCSSTSAINNYLPFTANKNSYPTGSNWVNDLTLWSSSPSVIWNSLQKISRPALSAENSTDPNKKAWIELAIISKTYSLDTNVLIQQLILWRTNYPNHPANVLFPNNKTLEDMLHAQATSNIAVLLPLQGPSQHLGAAVRDGFLSAYYQHLAKTHIQQTISFIDTSMGNNDISALYQQALNKGANFVIGPLLKNEVEKLLSSGSFSVPTLSLNFTEHSFPKNYYQFGLSPTDEAEQMADKAFANGQRKALLIAPNNPWGANVIRAFTARWTQLGGVISDSLLFDSSTNFTLAIPKLLHIDPNADLVKNKKDNDKNVLQKQRRKDFDAVFMIAAPANARQIVPLLRYYYVNNLPIYATSIVYSGIANPTKDSDLNGVQFCDLPWILKLSSSQPSGQFDSRFNRLYGVGRDAYLISSEFNRLVLLPNFPIYGSTGALSLNSQQTFQRRLPWTEFRAGRP